MIERKIGDRFVIDETNVRYRPEYSLNRKTVECVKSYVVGNFQCYGCNACIFSELDCFKYRKQRGSCSSSNRIDKMAVHFVEVK